MLFTVLEVCFAVYIGWVQFSFGFGVVGFECLFWLYL